MVNWNLPVRESPPQAARWCADSGATPRAARLASGPAAASCTWTCPEAGAAPAALPASQRHDSLVNCDMVGYCNPIPMEYQHDSNNRRWSAVCGAIPWVNLNLPKDKQWPVSQRPCWKFRIKTYTLSNVYKMTLSTVYEKVKSYINYKN